jgi:hypothetical protein
MPQGIPTKANMTVPLEPHREKPTSDYPGFDRVSQLALLARGWFKAQGLTNTVYYSFTSNLVMTLTPRLTLRANRMLFSPLAARSGTCPNGGAPKANGVWPLAGR